MDVRLLLCSLNDFMTSVVGRNLALTIYLRTDFIEFNRTAPSRDDCFVGLGDDFLRYNFWVQQFSEPFDLSYQPCTGRRRTMTYHVICRGHQTARTSNVKSVPSRKPRSDERLSVTRSVQLILLRPDLCTFCRISVCPHECLGPTTSVLSLGVIIGTRRHANGIQNMGLDVCWVGAFREVRYDLCNDEIVYVVVLHQLTDLNRRFEIR